jgi:nucleoside-diphosphate-sugar epimerase
MTGRNRILVTGATGLVGSHLVRALLERGDDVVATLRRSSDTSSVDPLRGHPGLRVLPADLSDGRGFGEALDGVDAVVHTAAAVDAYGSRSEIRATNVDGTRALLEASIAAGVRHFLHLGSLSVIAGRRDQYALNESAPLRRCGEAYADSKLDAERLVMAEAPQRRIAVTTLRPGFIYGPGERAWMPRLIEALAAGKVRLIHGGRKETNVIYVGNLCRAITAAILNPAAYGQVYNLTDGQHVTKKQLFDAICEGLALPKPTRSVPAPLARAVSELVSLFAPALPLAAQKKLARFSRAAYRLSAINQGIDVSKAERELGYTDRVAFAEAMAETLRSFRRAESEARAPRLAVRRAV